MDSYIFGIVTCRLFFGVKQDFVCLVFGWENQGEVCY